MFTKNTTGGAHVIEYYFAGSGCQSISFIDFPSTELCNAGAGLTCGFIAPIAKGSYFDTTSDYDGSSSYGSRSRSSSSASISLSSSQGAASACELTSCGSTFTDAIPVDTNDFLGVAVFVPANYTISLENVTLIDSTCVSECTLALPAPVCSSLSTPPSSPQSADGRFARLAADDGTAAALACGAPSASWLAKNRDAASESAAARAWANALSIQFAGLMECKPETTASNTEHTVKLPKIGVETSCDYEQCAATLHKPSALTGNRAPATVTDLLARAAELARLARAQYSQSRYAQSRQSACCAEAIVRDIAAAADCPRTACTLMSVYASTAEPYANIGDNQNSKRAAAGVPTDGGGEHLVLFEQCNAPQANTAPDYDGQDAVFAVSAKSIVENRTAGAWLASIIDVETIAIGSVHDFSLELNFADSGVPAGSQVRVVHFGLGAAELCYTADSIKSETLECPSASSVRLFRSLRAALPPAKGAASPFINTVAGHPRSTPTHLASLFIRLPLNHYAAPSLRLAFELHSRDDISCVVSTALYDPAQRAFGVIVPAPFLYPREGVPMFIDPAIVPTGGLCVGGDNTAMLCNEPQECAGGYCELHGPHAFHCINSPQAGVNTDTLCSRDSQCPYGFCYGHAEAPTEYGLYPALAEFLASAGKTNRDWSRARPLDPALVYDVATEQTLKK